MASNSRNERQQMRQRGAANRRVNTVDFDLNFRTSVSSRRSASLRRSREPSQPRSRRSASAREPTDDIPDQPSSSKRRRLTVLDHALNTSNQNVLQSSATPHRPSSPLFPITVIAEDEPQTTLGDDAGKDGHDYEKENDEPRRAKPAPRRKKRKSIGQQSMRKKKRSSGDGVQGRAQDHVPPQQEPEPEPEPESEPEPERAEEPSEIGSENGGEDSIMAKGKGKEVIRAPPLVAKPQKRRKKRKSVILVKRKRSSLNKARTSGLEPGDKSEPLANQKSSTPVRAQPPTTGASHTSPILSSAVQQRRDLDEDSEDEYVDEEHSPEPPTPAPSRKDRKGKQAVRHASSGSRRPVSQTASQHSRNRFPVVTYRMTNFDSLPTIAENGAEGMYSENGPDPRQERNAALERKVPNSVEVLAQVCRESVAGAVDRVQRGPADSHGKADRKRKIQALETVADDIDKRLFEMSAAVENRIHLESRVRRAKRTKTELQARWIEVRRQREQTALKCDLVRRQHWEEEQEREERWHTSDLAYKVEAELQRGEPDEEESLEYLLRSVAAAVSGKAEGGGRLDRIKNFNAELEALAGVLEGRGT